MRNELELYLHIPFCVRKCAYCDFLSEPSDKETISRYLEALKKEIRSQKTFAEGRIVITIFLGGGTPSILAGAQMQELFEVLREVFVIDSHAEISIEVNPGTITEEKLLAYRKAGVNRISFGLQSTNNEELQILERIHTYETFLESFYLARSCGFDNINVDLISAIPNQTVESWEESLNRIIELNPEHISAYSLIIEEGTPFFETYGEGAPGEALLPSEEDERRMYQRTEELLREAGYYRYEISNYAKNGKACRHNLGYWDRTSYLGMGLGASSLIENERFRNCEDLSFYMEHAGNPDVIRESEGKLSIQEQMEEFVFLGLRKMEGISIAEFENLFGVALEACYGHGIQKMKQQKLIEEHAGMLYLTPKGIDISNFVFAEILYPSC